MADKVAGQTVTPRQYDALKALEGMAHYPKGAVTTAAVAEKLGISSGPTYNHLIALKSMGLVGQRSKAGETIPGSWYVTPRGERLLAENGRG